MDNETNDLAAKMIALFDGKTGIPLELQIEPTELRIGNLINFAFIPCRISMINALDNTVCLDDDLCPVSLYDHNIEPIELTADILEAKGFQGIDDDGLYESETEPLFQLQLRYLEENGFDFIWDGAFTGIVIASAHHLQNVFYALTQTELSLSLPGSK